MQVLTEIVRCSQVVLVAVQTIGLAAEPAERLQAGDDPCLDRVPRAFELGGVRSLLGEAAELLVDGRLELVGRVPRACRGLDGELRAEDQRFLRRLHRLRDLLVVDERLVEPARFAAAEDVGGQIGLRVARLEDRRRQPRHVDARQLHGVGDGEPLLGGDRRRRRRDLRHVRPALQAAEVLLDQAPGRDGIEVADDRQAGVVRRVVLAEELLHVAAARAAARSACEPITTP